MPADDRDGAVARPHGGYLPGLDGLRAVSVLAVLAYHAGMTWLPGGFLGVEVFFVISGYLITLLLTRERDRTGTISLPNFWLRRARRLLPALYAALVATAIVVVGLYREEVRELPAQLWSAVTYVTNWFFIFSEQSYFASIERPPVLQHLWSLAIEEQFYLVWPVLLFVLLRLTGGRRLPVAGIALAGAVGSSLLMAMLFQPAADPSRVYYGTDTRASGLLLGAALGLVLRPAPSWRQHDEVPVVALDLTGFAGLGVLVACFVGIDEFDRFLYQGGFAVVGVASAAMIVSCVHPSTVFGWVTGNRWVTWIGRRSYSLYLWHWPIFVFTRPEIDQPLGLYPTLAIRLALTFAAAELSYRFVEVPIRNGALGRWLGRRPEGGSRVRQYALRAGAGTLAIGCAFGLVAVSVAASTPPSGATGAAGPAGIVEPGDRPGQSQPGQGGQRGGGGSSAGASAQGGDGKASKDGTDGKDAGKQQAGDARLQPAGAITVLADSVLLGADEGIVSQFSDAGARVEFRGEAAIMVPEMTAVLRDSRQRLSPTVIVGLGYNSLWERDRANFEHWSQKFDREADELLATIADLGGERVVWVTLREPSRELIPPSALRQYDLYAWYFPYANERIRMLPERHPNLTVVDWAAVSNQPGLTYDTMHLTTEGTNLMVSLVKPAVGLA